MKYIYNTTGNIKNGIIFFFNPGDENPASVIMEVIAKSFETPTSIVWGENVISRNNAVKHLYPVKRNKLERGTLMIRLTFEDDPTLIKDCFDALEKRYPSIKHLIEEFRKELLPKTVQLN